MNSPPGGRSRPAHEPPRFLLVEDQVLVREFLCRDLREAYPACTITRAGSLAEIRSIGEEGADFDLAIVDLDLPDGRAIDWARQSAHARPDLRIVILSALDEDFVLYQAMHSGVPGYVHKNDRPGVLLQAVEIVLNGGVFYSPSVLQMCRQKQADPDFFNKILTAREQSVLQLSGSGLPNEEVAAILGLSESSIATHRKQIMAKLGVHSQGELMKYAVSKGFSRLH